jgi:hypothetical protein
MRSSSVWEVALLAAPVVLLPIAVITQNSLFAVAFVLSIQLLAGVVLSRRFVGDVGVLNSLGMGLGLGTSVAAILGVVGLQLGTGSVAWPMALLLVILLWFAWVDSKRIVRPTLFISTPPSRTGATLALTVGGILSLLAFRINVSNYPLNWRGEFGGYHPDMPFFEALATSIARFGPFDSIFLPGSEVRYHWLVYGWAGQLSEVTGAEPFVVLTRVLPLVTLLASLFIVVSWASRASKNAWVPTLAVLLFVTAGYLGSTNGGVMNFDSPSQSMAVVWLLAFCVIVLKQFEFATSPGRGAKFVRLALVGMLAFSLTGGKVSAAVPALGGVCALAAVGLVRRTPWAKDAMLMAIVSLGASAGAYLFFLSGSSGSGGLTVGGLIDKSSSQLGLNPIEGNLGIILGTLILCLAICIRWIGLAWLIGDRETRWQPMTILGAGVGGSALIGVLLFNSFNEIWFANAASGVLAVLAAVGCGRAVDYVTRVTSRSTLRVITLSALAALVVVGLVWGLWLTGASGGLPWVSTLRWAGPIVGFAAALALAVAMAKRPVVGRRIAAVLACTIVILTFAVIPGRFLGVGTGQVGQTPGLRPDLFSFGEIPLVKNRDQILISDIPSGFLDAGSWIRSNADRNDILATNLTFGPLIPALARIRTYVSGMQYAAPYGRPELAAELLLHENQSWDFIDTPSASTLAPLCDAGVTWVWVYLPSAKVRDWEPFATTEFANEETMILNTNCSS